MDNIIDFKRKRAIMRSGISDIAVIDDMLKKDLDPCNPIHRKKYNEDCALEYLISEFKSNNQDLIDYDTISLDNITIDTMSINLTYDLFKDDDD